MASSRDSLPAGDGKEPSSDPESPGIRRAPSTIYQMEIALLRVQVTRLTTALERERERRQAVIDRYERVIDER